ncbi:hypothetical protein ACFVHB_24565 [Kitasatospora sp. NPDC127111]|uniref:hypothetical protein n=1 Tax=Kitasatospora sp. NPDC127111 TaxID=3345363 RepID=UPI00363FC298
MTSTPSHSATPPHGRPAGLTPDDARALDGHGTPDGHGTLPAGPWGLTGAPGPWSVRSARATRGRAALEVYEYGELVDVLVAARLAAELLGGARRCAGAGRAAHGSGLAWGRLPVDGAPVVRFTRGWAAGRALATPELVTVAGEFWLAWAAGRFTGVRVEHAGRCVRRPLVKVRGRGRGAR